MLKKLMLAGGIAVAASLFVFSGSASAAIVFGACCNNGCCLPAGECRPSTQIACNGPFEQFQGEGTDCEKICFPTGACCLSGGGCSVETEGTCSQAGTYQGDGTSCETAECALPTTTTVLVTTTTVDTTTTTTYNPTTTLAPTTTTTEEPIVVICGDANNDKDITAADALIALKTSVGSASCSVYACDYNGSGSVLTSDALAILKVAVGQVVIPQCPVQI